MVRQLVARFSQMSNSLVGGLILGSIAWVFLVLHLGILLGSTADLPTLIVTTIIPIMLSITLFVGAIGVYWYDLDVWAFRISGWTILGAVLFTVVLGIEFLYLHTVTQNLADLRVLLINVAASGAVLGFLIGLYDAQQRRLRQNLQGEYDRTISLAQRLSVLARILRHDLRNNLNIMLGHAQRLTENPEEEEQAMEAIQHAGDELLAISNNIQEFSTTLADPVADHACQEIDLRSVVTNAIDIVQSRYESENVSIELTVEESVCVLASPFFHKAVVEILENAIIHNDSETPQIDVTITKTADARPRAELHITDNGPGIPSDELAVHDLEFETPLEHSTGVGLWLVRWVVDASDGEFHVTTNEPTGSTVIIKLPLTKTS